MRETNPLRERLEEYRKEKDRILGTIAIFTPPRPKYAKDYFQHMGFTQPAKKLRDGTKVESYTPMSDLMDEIRSAASGGYLDDLTDRERYELQDMVEVLETLTDRFRVFAHRGGEPYRDLKRKFKDTKEAIE